MGRSRALSLGPGVQAGIAGSGEGLGLVVGGVETAACGDGVLGAESQRPDSEPGFLQAAELLCVSNSDSARH